MKPIAVGFISLTTVKVKTSCLQTSSRYSWCSSACVPNSLHAKCAWGYGLISAITGSTNDYALLSMSPILSRSHKLHTMDSEASQHSSWRDVLTSQALRRLVLSESNPDFTQSKKVCWATSLGDILPISISNRNPDLPRYLPVPSPRQPWWNSLQCLGISASCWVLSAAATLHKYGEPHLHM